jgi:hypothetical protein
MGIDYGISKGQTSKLVRNVENVSIKSGCKGSDVSLRKSLYDKILLANMVFVLF